MNRVRTLEAVSIGTTAAAFAITVLLVSTGRAAEANPVAFGLLDAVGWSLTGVFAIGVEALAFAYLARHREDGLRLLVIRGRSLGEVNVGRLVDAGGVAIATVGVLDVTYNLYLLSLVGSDLGSFHVARYSLPIALVFVAGLLAFARDEIRALGASVVSPAREFAGRIETPDERPDRLGFRVAVLFFVVTVVLSGIGPFFGLGVSPVGTVRAGHGDTGGDVYVGTNNPATVQRIDADAGSTVWNVSVDGSVDGDGVVATGSYVYAGSGAGTIYKLDPSDGSTVATIVAAAGVRTLEQKGDHLYAGLGNGDIAKISISSFSTDTTFSGVHGTTNGVSYIEAGAGEFLYSGGYDNTVNRLNTSGGVKWSASVGATVTDISYMTDGLAVSTAQSTSAGKFLNLVDGSVAWSYNPGVYIQASGATPGGKPLWGTNNNEVVENTTTGGNGWTQALSNSVYGLTHGNGVIYAGDVNGRIESIDSNGAEVWGSDLGSVQIVSITTAPPGKPDIRGQVSDQSGAAVANATVELWLMDDANTTTDAGETVEDAQEDTIETISRSVPRDLYDPDVDQINGDQYANTASKQVLVHQTSAWYEEAEPIDGHQTHGYAGTNDLRSPLIQIEPDTPYAFSIWDRTRQPFLEDGVDEKIDPGVSTSGRIVVEQIGPGNDTVDDFSAETVEQVRTGTFSFQTAKKHEFTEVSLPEGYYRVRAQNGSATTILRVGSPEEIPRQIRPDLQNAANQSSAIAQEVNDKLNNGEMQRVTLQTNESGYFNKSSVPSGTSTVAITVFDGQGLTDGITDPTVSDLQTQIERQNYNGSIYFSTSPEIVHPPDRNISITVTEIKNPSLGDLESYFRQLAWLEDYVNEESFASLSHLFTDSLNSTARADVLETRDKLRDTVLANPMMHSEWEEIAAERGVETNLFADDLSTAELREQVEALLLATSRAHDTIETDDWSTDTTSINGGGTNVNVNVDLGERINETANATNAVCQAPDGSTRWVASENVSVDNGLTGSTVTIQEILANSTAGCNYIITAPGEDGGLARETVNVENPGFAGEVPELASINLNTQRPGPDEEVRIDVTPTETSSFESLQGVTVVGPDGSSINSSVADGVASFRTNGAGSHLVKLNVSDGSSSYIETIRVKAGESSVDYPASVRVHNGVLGRTVVASDGVEAGRISVEDGGSAARITAEVDSADVPRTIHVHARDLTGVEQEVTVAVVSAEDGSQVKPGLQIKLHVPRLSDEAHVRVDGHPITEDGSIWGKRESYSDSSLITTNLRDGTISTSINNNPGLLDRVSWYGSLVAERIPVGLLVPIGLEVGPIELPATAPAQGVIA